MRPAHETLYDLYWNQGQTLKQIGELYGVNKETARDWFSALGIERRPRGHNAFVPALPKADKQTLVSLYYDERLSLTEVGKRLEVSAGTAQKWLASYGLATRGRGTNAADYPDKPSKETLEDLYLTQRLTQRQIAKLYGVSHKTVGVWVRGYGIPQRAQSRGLDNREIEPPTSDELYRMIHFEHKGYAEIASLYGVDSTAVPHWLAKHGIEKPKVWNTRTNGRWIQFDRETLENLYVEKHLSTLQIAARYGVSSTAVRNWMKHYGLSLRPDGWGNKRFECNDGHSVRSTYERKVCNWLSDHGIAHEYEPALPFDRRYKSDFLANGWYIEIWGVKNDPTYNERRKKKVKLYKQHGLPLIEIRPDCFAAKHKDRWARKLSNCLTAPDAVSPAQTSLQL